MIKTLFTKDKIPFTGLFVVSVLGIILPIFALISVVSEDMEDFGTTATQAVFENWPILIYPILAIIILFFSVAFLRATIRVNNTARIGSVILFIAVIAIPLLPVVISLLFMTPGQENGLGTGFVAGFFIGATMLVGIICALVAFIMLVVGYIKHRRQQRIVSAPLQTKINS